MLWAMAVSEWSRAIAVAAFVASYVGLALGRVPGFRIDRTGVAIIGAAVMVVSGAVPWTDAVASVDAPTLVLLFGMMIVTAYLRLSGFFRLVMTWALRRARTPLGLLAAVVAASGGLSAFFVNDVVCLVLAPVVLAATRQLGLPPVPYLVALAIVAIAGAGCTLLTRVKPEKVYREVNWGLLVLFAGLFVVTAGLEHSGIVGVFLHWAAAADLHRPAVLTAVTAVLSNLVSNVPAVLLLKPLIGTFPEPRRAWLVLAMASTL